MSFGSTPELTFGIEEEFFIIDEKGDLVPAADELFDKIPNVLLSTKVVSPEFHKSQVEINSGVCETVDEALEDLCFLRGLLNDKAEELGYRLVALGTHPTADWKKGVISPQYARNLVRREQLQAYLTCGMHVHISVQKEHAVKVINSARYFIPELIALTSNSPFWLSELTDFKDCRLAIIEQAHTLKGKKYAGLPPSLKNLKAWKDMKADIPMYWDIRPNFDYGTIEFRLFDVQPTLRESVAVAGLLRVLVGELIRKRIGFLFKDEKELFDARAEAMKGNFSGFDFLDKVVDKLSLYGMKEKDLEIILKRAKERKTPADEQIALYRKKGVRSITIEFSKRFI